MRTLLVSFFLFLGSNAHAADSISGSLVSAPATVKALSEEGKVEEYSITSLLNTVSVDGNSVMLSNNGVMAMCGDYYGQLAEDFTVKVKLKDSSQKTVTVKAAAKGRSVSVFGMCQGHSRILEQLQLDIREGAGPEIR